MQKYQVYFFFGRKKSWLLIIILINLTIISNASPIYHIFKYFILDVTENLQQTGSKGLGLDGSC